MTKRGRTLSRTLGVLALAALIGTAMSCDGNDTLPHDCFHVGHHIWGSWNEDVAPSCTGSGRDIRECRYCGANDTRAVSPLGHDWGYGGGWVGVPPLGTCTTPTFERRACRHDDCDVYQERTVIHGHTWGEWETVRYPVCLVTGLRKRFCEDCGVEARQAVASLLCVWGEWSVRNEPDGGEPIYEERNCSVCRRLVTRRLDNYGHCGCGNEVCMIYIGDGIYGDCHFRECYADNCRICIVVVPFGCDGEPDAGMCCL